MRKVVMSLSLSVIHLIMSGCGSGQTSITGEIQAYGDYPIAGRKIALGQISDQILDDGQEVERCTLLETVAVSDQNGFFEFKEIPLGNYLLFYDSGLSDFDVAVGKWAGKTLRISDRKWLLESFLETDKSEISLHLFKESANLLAMQGMERTQQYLMATFMIGNSPFILAHDVDRIVRLNELSIIIAVVGDKNQKVQFPAVYLKQ